MLNATICNNVVFSVVNGPGNQFVIVGRGVTNHEIETKPFPLSLGGKPRAWMDASFRFCYDPEREFLTVLSCFVGISADEHGEQLLCHFDYEREKADDYPEAHIQVYGQSPVLDLWDSQPWAKNLVERGLHRLHFPAGHRRFRWCLEDVIEFVIREGIAEARPGWEQALEPGRTTFHRIQLRAAMRRDLDTAISFLEEIGYEVRKKR